MSILGSVAGMEDSQKVSDEAVGSNPRIRQCAAHLARKFHDTQERKRCPAHALERYDWNELPDSDRTLLVKTFYSLVHQGVIVCPLPEHRIGIDLRVTAT
jgi:hypothetical protein